MPQGSKKKNKKKKKKKKKAAALASIPLLPSSVLSGLHFGTSLSSHSGAYILLWLLASGYLRSLVSSINFGPISWVPYSIFWWILCKELFPADIQTENCPEVRTQYLSFPSHFISFFFFWLCPQRAEVPRLGTEPMSQQWPSHSSDNARFFFLFSFFTATPAAYGSSWVRGWIGVAAASLHHSHIIPIWATSLT